MLVEVTEASGPAQIRGNEFLESPPDAFFLHASVDGEPVGQICHLTRDDGHWVDWLFVRGDYRNTGIGYLLIECCLHDALKCTDEIYALMRRRNPFDQYNLYKKHTRDIGGSDDVPEVRVLKTHDRFVCNVRDLRPLRERILNGSVQKISFPLRRELQDQRPRGNDHERRPALSP